MLKKQQISEKNTSPCFPENVVPLSPGPEVSAPTDGSLPTLKAVEAASEPELEDGAFRSALSRGNCPPSIGEILALEGVVSEEHIARALSIQGTSKKGLAAILIELGLCTELQIRSTLERHLGVRVTELRDFSPNEELLDQISTNLIHKFELIPIHQEEGVLHIAMTDPYNLTAMGEIMRCVPAQRMEVVKCGDSDFEWFKNNYLEAQTIFDEILEGSEFYDRALSSLSLDPVEVVENEDEEPLQEVHFDQEQAPIIVLCNFLLVEAIKRRASDLHIEPYEESFRLRLRIDGRLQTLLTPPKQLFLPVISRFKVMSDLDITMKRVPQDGRISIRYQGGLVDFRVSTLPTIFGEKCVIRVLKKQHSLMALDKIGFTPEALVTVEKAIRKPQGLVLVTGPTGSGKSTTVHSSLNEINDIEMNIITLEDPCEVSIPGINHVQINEKNGVTFAGGLRSVLRQDPDVIFVGEMRDKEVAQVAVRAALTGHLVMSTLHTNSASETLTRLVDIGIPGYLLCHGLLLIVAQRLVRVTCPQCAIPHEPTSADMADFNLTPELLEGAELHQAQGCPRCRNTGYHGRTAVYEVLHIDDDIREMVRRDAHASEIMELAKSRGMQSIFEAGVAKALAGITTLSEVRRVLSDVR